MATYEKAAQMALRTRGPDLAAIYTELGPMYVDDEQARSGGERARDGGQKEAGSTPLLPAAQRNLSIAYFKRGLARMRDPKQADGALDDMVDGGEGAEGRADGEGDGGGLVRRGDRGAQGQQDPAGRGRVGRGDQGGRRRRLRVPAAVRQAGHEVLRRLHAVSRLRQPGRSARARSSCSRSSCAKATGGTADWLRALLRSGYELLAYDFYQRSDEKRAGQYLASASKVPAKGDKRELEHNLAVIDLFSGKSPQAERVFDALGTRPCEARVNLGILRDRQGESKKALELYKQAQACGAHAPKLAEWIDVKERLFGGGP